jgi:hypothetical protein
LEIKKRGILICGAISLIAISTAATYGRMPVVEKAKNEKYR